MAYSMFFDDLRLPVVPEKISVSMSGENKAFRLISDEAVNILRRPALKEIAFEMLIPNSKYPFASYDGDFKDDTYYMQKLTELKESMKVFRFIYTRSKPDGRKLYSINLPVSMEECVFRESAEEGTDVIASVRLKEFREYGTKILKDTDDAVAASVFRETRSAPKYTQYTVKKGDTLWAISKKYLGNGERYKEIYNLNKDILKSPSLIYPGQVLKLPEAGADYGY